MLSPASSEYQVIRTYLDWLLSLPWHARSGAEEIELEEGRGGARRAALRARARRRSGSSSTSPCASCAAAIRTVPSSASSDHPALARRRSARRSRKAIGREFYRISVGGVRDEAEIRGHRRTYVGAMPGLVIQAMRRVALRDPVLMIDEIDKMTSGGP